MTNKIAFFYCNGTSQTGPFGLLELLGRLANTINQTPRILLTVAGLNGVTTTWPDGSAANDPFCNLLDTAIFEPKRIGYPAVGFPMNASMDTGITLVNKAITALPAGQKFMLGGFSQGAAVMSSIYNQLRSGVLSSRNSDFLGGVMFGNPRRQQNYRGSVGGTWSGAFNVAGSTTGGHGSFPATGTYARLSNCEPLRWIEFVEENDIFTAVNGTANALGQNWVAGNDVWTSLSLQQLAVYLQTTPAQAIVDAYNTASGIGAQVLSFTDGIGKAFTFPGNGHVAYPWRPPPGNPDNGLTSYQIAVKFLNAKAAEYSTAPGVLPSNPTGPATAGWSTTLIPPA